METPSRPTDRRAAYRPVLLSMTVLLAVGVLTSACLPLGPSQPSQPVVAVPAPAPEQPAPQPQQPEPAPVVTPPATPAPQPTKPPDLPAGEPSQLVVNGNRACKMIALTYDAGSGADGAAAILDVLKKHNLHSTFFLTGKWVEKYPDLAKRIANEGHEIANHTYSHPDLTQMAPEAAIKEIKDGEAAILKATGKDPKPLFREPYGAFNDAERRVVRQAGYSYSIYWEVDTLDWQFPGVEAEFKKLTEKTQNGSVVLMHLNVPDSALASDQAIPVLQAKGYQLVTVSQLLQCKP